jgi:hypothetical protein
MAERFGGKFSPQPRADDGSPAVPRPATPGPHPYEALRANLLFVLPFLFAWRAFTGGPSALVAGLIAFGVMLLGAWLTREGLKAEAEYNARSVARRPAIPRKIFGALCTGAGLAAATLMGGQPILITVAFGIIAAVLHLGAFGLDPLSDKGTEGIDQFQMDRVAHAVDEAEKHLTAMKDAILRAGDRSLTDRVERFAATARGLFRSVESDPGDLTAARKYLSVFLMGARDATVKFADIWARSHDARARADYEALLTDLETTFAEKTKDFLSGTRSNLDVEIAVLRDRLKFETPR